MNKIVQMPFGSRAYGTNIETSDYDTKAIYIPSAKDLLLCKGQKTLNYKVEGNDFEAIPLREFINQAIAGQTYALDMLFCTEVKEKTAEWDFIVQNRSKLLSRNIKPMVGYAKAQAMKYSLKGSRLNAVKDMIYLFTKSNNKDLKLSDLVLSIKVHYLNEFIKFKEIEGPQGKETHLEVVGKYFPLTASVEYVLEKLEIMRDKYGDRAKDVEENKGLDLKALYHAVRVCDEALELLTTGNITFPRPNAQQLLDIRNGLVTFEEISSILDQRNEEIEQALKTTTLPEKADEEFWNNFVFETYSKEVIKHWR